MFGIFPILLAFVLSSEDLGTTAQRAKEAMTTGNFSRAILLYRDISRSQPQDPAIRVNLGLALHSAGRYSDALDQFQFVLHVSPDNSTALLFSGIDLLKLDQPATAIQHLSRFLAHDSRNSIALLELGNAFQKAGRFDDAKEVFLKLSESDPNNPKYWDGLGKSYWSLAKHEFDLIDASAPFSAEWYSLLARSALQQGDYNRAFQLYREALSRSPNLCAVHQGLAEIYRKTEHPDWALVEDAREVEIRKADPSSQLTDHYVRALDYQHRSYDALDRLNQLPQSPELHAILGQAYRMQQRDRESADEFGRALEFDRGNLLLEKEMATSLWLSRDFNEAVPILQKLTAMSPDSPELNHLLGDCLLQQHLPEKAIPYLETALTEKSDFLPAQASLGRSYLHVGRYTQAIIHLKKALPLGDDALLYQLAEAYKKLGNQNEAEKYLYEFKSRSANSRTAGVSAVETRITPP